MPALANAKHETFAQNIAKGMSGRDAYRAAGYNTKGDAATDVNASRLLSDAKVQARLDELKERAATNTVTTMESLLEACWGVIKEARSSEDFGAASQTIERAAKIAGLWIDKSQQSGSSQVVVYGAQPVTADEWASQYAPTH